MEKVGAVGLDANLLWNTCAELSQGQPPTSLPWSLLGDVVFLLYRLKGDSDDEEDEYEHYEKLAPPHILVGLDLETLNHSYVDINKEDYEPGPRG